MPFDAPMNGIRTERGARALAVAAIAAVAVMFVYATQPWVHPKVFYETSVWGILVLLAFVGWGGALDVLLFRDRRADFGLRSVWGASMMLFLGGVLASTSSFSRFASLALVDIGLVAFCVQRYRERRACRDRVVFAWRVVRRNALLSTIVGVVLFAAVVHYLGGVADVTSNPNDDDTAYFPMVRRLIDTGTLIEPFSFRRLSALGGHTFFLALIIPHASYHQLNTFDRGICVVMIVALIVGYRSGRRRLPLAATALVVGFFLSLPNISINSAPHFAGFAFFLGMFRTMVFLRESDRLRAKAVVLALVAIATCTLRQNYLSVPVTTLAISYGYRLLANRGSGAPLRERLREPLVVASLSAFVLLPWLVLAYRSNQTFLFPLQNGTYRKALELQSATATWLRELRLLISVALENEPIKVLGLLALAGALVRDHHPYKPLRSFWISCALGLVILTHSFSTADAGNLARYLFGYFAALAAAVLLTVGTQPFFGRDAARNRAVLALALGALLLQFPSLREKASQSYQTFVRNIDIQRRRPPQSLDTLPHEVFMYGHIQSFVPAGARMAVMVDEPYHLDFVRNTIFNIDMPGFSSLKPDMPYFEGPEKVAEYFLAHDIRYVVYVRPEFSHSLYQREFWFVRMFNEEEIWRMCAPYFVDFIDSLTSLRESRKNVYEEAGIVVLDLATRR
jgi:hypothetical protein